MANLLFAWVIFFALRFSCSVASNSDIIYYFQLNSTTISGVIKTSDGTCSDQSSITIQGSSPTTEEGPDESQSDPALSLASDNWANLGDFRDTCISNPALCPNGMSVSFWVRLDVSGSGDRHVISTGKMDTSRGIQVFYTNSHTNVVICDGTKRYPAEIDFPTYWTHVVAVYNPNGATAADKFYVYVNGTQKETARYETKCDLTDTDTNLLIGHDNAGSLSGGRQFAISQLAFFFKLLNQTDIQQIYSNPNSGIQLDCSPSVPPTTITPASAATGSGAVTDSSATGAGGSQQGQESDNKSRSPTVLILLSVSLFFLLVIVIIIAIGCCIIVPRAKEKGYKCF